jgi:hypothetical protein
MAITVMQNTTRFVHSQQAIALCTCMKVIRTSHSELVSDFGGPMTGIAFVAAGGILALVLLAVLIGNADARAQREAWNRIARHRRELGDWERQLIRAAESEGCPACRLLRERGGLHDQI